jgi:hypothetical protein
MTTKQSATLAETIDAPFDAVAADLADPMNHPQWATEFFDGPATDNGDGSVSVNVPLMGGPARMKIDADCGRGMIDLFLAPGEAPFGDPLTVRLIPNGDGVDILWTLQRPDGIPDPAWREGLESMARELANLKSRHETGAAGATGAA